MATRMRLTGIVLTVVAGIFLLAGCAHQGSPESADKFMERWRARAEESRGNSPAPSPAAPAPEPAKSPAAKPAGLPADAERERPLPTKRISLKMSNVDVSTLLRALARAADVNIILNDRVAGRSNINIGQAPWDQVFLGILRTHNLTYAWQGDIIRIMTAEDLEEDLRRESRKRELQISEAPLTRIVPVKFASAKDLQENLKNFLSLDRTNKPIGAILVDQHTNSLIINALRSDLQAILAVVEKLDQPTPQVLIEAYIVEANKDVARELGIQWGGAVKVSNVNDTLHFTGKNNNVLGQGIGTPVNPSTGNVVDLPAAAGAFSGLAPTSLGIIYQNVGKALLTAQLTALQDEGKVNILSSPSITTIDNQTALIESGRDIPFQSVEDGEVNIQYKKAVLSLKVTPHVIDSGTLKLSVKVNKDEVDFSRQVLGNPTITTKNAETNVIQANGQTLVIGGLNKETVSEDRSGTPYLMDIPVLGWLFKTKGNSNQKEDLLIFITPTILGPPSGSTSGG
jgi:type IV pilus assembly protein PilQ